MTIEEVLKQAISFQNANITITGGEPCLQMKDVLKISRDLYYDGGYNISIETNGTFEMYPFPEINWVADWKGLSSGMRDKMDIQNYRHLRSNDFIKFVIEDESDFKDAIDVIKALKDLRFSKEIDGQGPKFAFSPSYRKIGTDSLIEWMQNEMLLKQVGAILNVQLHKVLNIL